MTTAMKQITMTQFRKEPGVFINEVSRHGQSFELTNNGKPVARLVPVEDVTTIESDGAIKGPRPLTMQCRASAPGFRCRKLEGHPGAHDPAKLMGWR